MIYLIIFSVLYFLGFIFFLFISMLGGGEETPAWKIFLWPIAIIVDWGKE